MITWPPRPIRVRLGQNIPAHCIPMTHEEWNAAALEKEEAWQAVDKSTLDELCAVVDGEFRLSCWFPDGNKSGQSSAPEVAFYESCADAWARTCDEAHPACPYVVPQPEPAPEPQPEPAPAPPGNGGIIIQPVPIVPVPIQEPAPPEPVEEKLPPSPTIEEEEGIGTGGALAAAAGVGVGGFLALLLTGVIR